MYSRTFLIFLLTLRCQHFFKLTNIFNSLFLNLYVVCKNNKNKGKQNTISMYLHLATKICASRLAHPAKLAASSVCDRWMCVEAPAGGERSHTDMFCILGPEPLCLSPLWFCYFLFCIVPSIPTDRVLCGVECSTRMIDIAV